jgi:transcriptional regulator with XRE-family HTH domain
MSRPPTHYSIVREIRKILGWTQPTLANRIGMTAVTIARIESGSLKASHKAALRIAVTTGVRYPDILANKRGVPQTLFGDLQPDGAKDSEEHSRNMTPEQVDLLIYGGAQQISHLIKDCLADVRTARKVWALMPAIEVALDELRKEFGIARRDIPRPRATKVINLKDPATRARQQKQFEETFKQRASERSAKKPERQPREPGHGIAV